MPVDGEQPEASDDAFFAPIRELLAEGEPTPIAPGGFAPEEPPVEASPPPAPVEPPEATEPDEPAHPVRPDDPAVAAAAAAAAAAVAVAPADDALTATRASRRSAQRRRTILIAGGAAVVIAALAIGAAVVTGGGGSSNQAAPKSPTIAPTTTRPAPTSTTTVSADGSERTGPQGTTVTVNADVLFDVGAADLTPNASARLGQVLTLAQSDTSRHLLVEGYTDSTGDPVGNQRLSEARAQSVAQWLTQQGIDGARITVVGHGADDPVAPNDTPDNRALNRRVVVTLQTAGASQ